MRTYSCICDYLGVPVLEDMCWDIDIIYPLSNIDKLDLAELSLRKSQLSVLDVRAMMTALKYNEYFTTLMCSSNKLGEAAIFVADALQHNNTIEKLILPNSSISKDACIAIANSIAINPYININHIDLSGNPLEVKQLSEN